MSQQGQLHNPVHFATELPDNCPIAFVVGAFAVGAINPQDHPYVSLYNYFHFFLFIPTISTIPTNYYYYC